MQLSSVCQQIDMNNSSAVKVLMSSPRYRRYRIPLLILFRRPQVQSC